MARISVIIPAYNAEKTIQETVESVLQQTHTNLELIVINDGSTDKTLDILNQFQDPRIRIFSYPNSGLPVSRNRGFAHSVGEYVAFLDADDLWTPDKLESQLKALEAHPEAGVAYSWTDFIDESGKFMSEGCHITANGNVYAQLLLTCFVVSGSNPLIRREALEKVGGFDETIAASQDFDMYLRLAACYPYVAVAEPKVLYRISNVSMSTNTRRLEATSLLVRERAFERAPEPLPPALKRHSIANFYKSLLYRLLERSPDAIAAREAVRFFKGMIHHDPGMLGKRVTLKICLKILVFLILPPKLARIVLERGKGLFNINALLGYIKVEPSQIA